MLSLQGQRAADKINGRSLDTLTTQSTMFVCVCVCLRGRAQSVPVCKVHPKDVERHFERVESCAEYAEPVFICDQNDDRRCVAAAGSEHGFRSTNTQESKIQKTRR